MSRFQKFRDKVTDAASQWKEQASEWAESASEYVESAAEGVGELFDSKLHETGPNYCSWCWEKHACTPVESSNFSRNVYRCDGCGNEIVKCRACNNYAKFRNTAEVEGQTDADGNTRETEPEFPWGWENQFCAVHSGTVANFEHLNDTLGEITEFKPIFEREGRNFRTISTTAAGMVGSAAIIAPLAVVAAPAAGAAVGSFYGLSGAAATSKGLAVLGGGAVASGGWGMAGGVGVVTATGAALGGKQGGALANGYFGDVDGFDTEKLKDGDGPTVICINGFLTEGIQSASLEWLRETVDLFSDQRIVHLQWESKRLLDIGQSSAGPAAWAGMSKFGVRGFKNAASAALPVGAALSALGIASNPWSIARVKAMETGAILADLIARTDRRYVLVGHSLGARVIYFCLNALNQAKEEKGIFVEEAHLLGGAVDTNCSKDDDVRAEAEQADENIDWSAVSGAVNGNIWNYYSENDDVLKYLYTAGELCRGKPVGRNPIYNSKVRNIDVSACVGGHGEYIENLRNIFKQGAQ
ncbi:MULTISPECIES: DUF726 domain-containing protein [Halomonadaceae]|uniref:DUF726 domain-containing protein n=1 Tax=Vreelandella halophila TaxID=86177 RepID=A0A9X5B694_9GAMM|nr:MULTISPECIES: DUF726 domain-containing protein [Halomonas]MYL28165.1 DUF726 domain-containing protein [Halomonas utahensis]MYL76072.1 DUF726 domain-containing protein [Halomonas sp. 22501_18_FS]